ncbi:MAG: N-acetyl-gamma-glutamyl-phosphate reductase [Actinomycetota bacterium]
MSFRTAVFGASGYAGGELVGLIDGHPELDLVYLGAHSHAGAVLGDIHPQLPNPDRPLGAIRLEDAGPIDLAFLALPHGASAALGHQLGAAHVKTVDLGSDFRLDTAARYEEAYGSPHPFADELPAWSYGLPELFDLKGADLVASPGCYPTATLLAVGPLVREGLIESTGIVADCISGVTGAGRSLREDLLFGEVAEGVRAYGIWNHRHRPEIEMGLDLIGEAHGDRYRVTFTPHLIPIQRGLLATVTAPLKVGVPAATVGEALAEAYKGSPFVEVIDRPPQTRWTVGSNRALGAAFVDPRREVAIVQCAIDNLQKGASGQAVQAANLMLGIPEETGLSRAGCMP